MSSGGGPESERWEGGGGGGRGGGGSLGGGGVPFWLLTLGFGHNQRCSGIASSSGWGETVWWVPRPRRGPVARASGSGSASRRLGRPEGLIASNRRPAAAFWGRRADGRGRWDAHLEEAYGVFAAELAASTPEYAPNNRSNKI